MRLLGISLLLIIAAPLFAVSVKDVAIYRQLPWPEGGAYPPLATASADLMTGLGLSWEFIDADDVNNNDLRPYYKLLFFPGGWAGGYNDFITETGKQNIRDFVSSGGSYVGMCAGSFFIADTVFWRENPSADSPQNVFGASAGYTLDMWDGVADGAIIDFAPWDTSEVGCDNFVGARMVDITVDQGLLPEAVPSLNVLYWGGPIYRPNAGQWTQEKVLARYDMDGFSGDEEPAIVTFPYGEGRILMSAVHPELSLHETNCQLFYDVTARIFLGQLVTRMMEQVDDVQLEGAVGVRILRFESILGMRYQVESSSDGSNWSDYGGAIAAESFEHVVKVPAADSGLQFRVSLLE
jgi:glutamine amidotransferase-like uncharacterized protein